MLRKKILLILLLLGGVTGCAKKEVPPVVEVPTVTPPRVEERRDMAPPQARVDDQELARVLREEREEHRRDQRQEREDWERWRLYGRSTPPLLAIFFDYDDFSIREDMWDRIRRNVRYLLENPHVRIELQGNCDERGTNEYNMALGMKRALEVKKVLIKLGIDEKRISVVSFGEERPLCRISDESCWAINRRVDFVIK